MQSLHDKAISFQLFLEDISAKSQHSSDNIDQLESRIRDIAYRMEDIVEPILVHSLALEYEANTQVPLTPKGRAASRCSTVKDGTVSQMSAESETETSLDDILGWCLDQDLENKAKYSHLPLTKKRAAAAFGNCVKEADLLFKEAMKMKKILDNKAVISGNSNYSHSIATTSTSRGPPDANDTMVGLKEDLNQILDRITSEQPALEVIPITGMGGIGKTTLARAVYDHHGKEGHFDLVLWATVSQQYNVKEILRVLSQNAGPDEILSVYQKLKGRRYLIILDDVWDEKVWDGVRIAFPDDNNYSRVIMSTRLSNVATYVSSSRTRAHQMELLNEEQSWDLLRETVYGHGAVCPGEFEVIGRKVSRSCKGLPLALVVIGGLLKFNQTRDYWNEVAASTQAKASVNDESLLKIMSLSYTNLPPHLKACFLYLGMFPEDEEIPTKKLVRLWCGEGFLKARESKTMEVVAEECLEELVERNLVLVKKKRYNGKIKTSSIHDLLRDLSLVQAQKEKFLYGRHGQMYNDTFERIIKDEPRRVSFPFLRDVKLSCSSSSPVRTLFQTQQRWDDDELPAIIPQFKLLRVFGKVELSSSLRISFTLNNLRLLHLQKSRFNEEGSIPKSISMLRNLETLLVDGDGYSGCDLRYDLILPVEIWEMPRLCHLVSEVKMKLAAFPAWGLQDEDSSIECSSSLQTLTGLVNFDFTPRDIQKLQNLKKLGINYKRYFYGDGEEKVFDLGNLVNLHHLEDLLTIFRDNYSSPGVNNIGFPRNLKKLRLDLTLLPWEKLTVIGDSLEHLQVLKLTTNAFIGKVWEPIEGGFPQLKYLKMEYLWDLEEWRAESKHFPSLEKLLIMDCTSLKEVPAEIGDIDTLEKLIVKIEEYNHLVAGFEESVRRIEEEQESAEAVWKNQCAGYKRNTR